MKTKEELPHKGNDIRADVSVLQNQVLVEGDYGPTLTKLLRELTIPRLLEDQARRLTTLFELSAEETFHPFTDEVLIQLKNRHGFSSLDFLQRLNAPNSEEQIIYHALKFGMDVDPEREVWKEDYSYPKKDRIAPKNLKMDKEDFQFLSSERGQHLFPLVFKRWISQALLYTDKKHSFHFGDPAKAGAWLYLMLNSQFFYEKMLYLSAITQNSSSRHVPPVDAFSPTNIDIPYAQLIKVTEESDPKETKIKALWKDGNLDKRIVQNSTQIITTGFGRTQSAIDELLDVIDILRLNNPDFSETSSFVIANMGSGVLQNPELLASLRTVLEKKGMRLGNMHLAIDKLSPEKLAQITQAYVFSVNDTTQDVPTPIEKGNLLAIANLLLPNFPLHHVTADIGRPLDQAIIEKSKELGVNVVLSSNCLIPHLDTENLYQGIINSIQLLTRTHGLLNIYGGYIGLPRVFKGILAHVVKNGNKITLYPLLVETHTGWETDSNMKKHKLLLLPEHLKRLREQLEHFETSETTMSQIPVTTKPARHINEFDEFPISSQIVFDNKLPVELTMELVTKETFIPYHVKKIWERKTYHNLPLDLALTEIQWKELFAWIYDNTKVAKRKQGHDKGSYFIEKEAFIEELFAALCNNLPFNKQDISNSILKLLRQKVIQRLIVGYIRKFLA